MTTQYDLTHRNNAMTDLVTRVGASGVIKLFSGAPPANCGVADSGTMLVQYAGNAAQFGTVANGVLTVSAVAGVAAAQSGTPGYFRWYPNGATPTNAVHQGTCGVAGSGADLILTAPTVTQGQTVNYGPHTVTAYGA